MREQPPTQIGQVRHVLGARVTVELDPNLAGVTPIYRGRIQSVGQIGSLVRIPQGLVDLVGTVTLVGIAELAGAQAPTDVLHVGDRWIQVQLLGEIDHGAARFLRGISNFPGIDDPVHFTTPRDLSTVFPSGRPDSITLGRLAASSEVQVALDVSKLVSRHAAVVGSTGSGKTSAVASLLQALSNGDWPSANVVVVDVHGEYSRALGASASVRSVLGSGEAGLQIPYWALPAADILRAFTGAIAGPTTAKTFSNLVAEQRKQFTAGARWLDLDPSAVTADTPVPFDIHAVWHSLDFENRETRNVKNDPSTVQVATAGVPAALTPTAFAPYGPAGQPPHQAPNFGVHGGIPEALRLGLLDPRLAFLREPRGTPEGPDPLTAAVVDWLGDTKSVSVLDFAGVPHAAAELAIGVVLQLLFEVAVHTPASGPGVGRPRPMMIVLEEAHRYLGESATNAASAAANRIAREGRKYGVGLLLVTQRPSELPDTALSQCGTLISLRLSNAADQGKIRQALPDSVAGLAEILPSLRTGEAVISGEAIGLPARVLINRPDPSPLADDPPIESWHRSSERPDLAPALARWRGVYET